MKICLSAIILFISFATGFAQNGKTFLQFDGKEGPGKGKHVVLISGDDEYRSEESMPMMAKILSEKYGFKTTVLFPIHPETGDVVPNYQNNIPGLEQLADADLMIMLIRFRDLPLDQMKHLEDYFKAGKPFIALRTSTHPFAVKDENSPYFKWNWNSKIAGWEGGFGQQIVGETWVAHHGIHKSEGTRALVDGVDRDADHPILRGVDDIWAPTDVYSIKNLPSSANVLLYGQSTAGMTAEAPLMYDKSIMPIAWTKEYALDGGKTGMVFGSTLGSSLDFLSEDMRRLVLNASFWLLDMPEVITPELSVDIVGTYEPTMFGFDSFRKGMRVGDFK
ncbi:ThuA domain-containing protein [Algoriphagus halophytocola]|uniref:ThuA domain-containing protein n=1 Tax=Algoriphagus halophytocola TaxID=2991499 RepID=A0ABY6MPW2_9BACT|nr:MULTISPECIES: ThuA domain-containing protein [unclassified Algoriphagus]UZD24444.1 ThuA domain-containing protein [Algoriphagus sp. TR-M5]WBL41808.1 ThuA domain-containing protein [Algoriphagus sp. TR-M9]